jgi:HlyD family secretion protein
VKAIFRNTSLERLSSPEQLDQLLTVTTPVGWLALVALCGLLCAAVGWGLTGTVATRVRGQGVIMAAGGVLNVVSVGAGRVTSIHVKPGDLVRNGQVVAAVTDPAVEHRVSNAQAELDSARQELDTMVRMHSTGAQLQRDVLAREQSAIEARISDLTRQAQTWKEQAVVDEGLMKKGLITRQQVAAGSQKVFEGEAAVARLRTELKRLSAENFSATSQSRQDILARQNHVSALQRQLLDAQREWHSLAQVSSPFAGRVLEVKTEPGSLVNAGGTVLTLEGDLRQLEAVLFVPATVGKQVQRGMLVEVSPSTVRREEFGFLFASVTYVSNFPVTPDAIMRRFGNELMLQSLATAGPLTEVRAELHANPMSPGGFHWSFSGGPANPVTSGTMCTADVVIREQRPVRLVLPALRSAL